MSPVARFLIAATISATVLWVLIERSPDTPFSGRPGESLKVALGITLLVFAPLNGIAGCIVRKRDWNQWWRLPIIAGFWLGVFSLVAIFVDPRTSGIRSLAGGLEAGIGLALLTFCYAVPATALRVLFPHARDVEG